MYITQKEQRVIVMREVQALLKELYSDGWIKADIIAYLQQRNITMSYTWLRSITEGAASVEKLTTIKEALEEVID